jgi:DNA-binding PucR family transcriptional regulator
LIPLKEEWLVLVSEQLLVDLREESEEGTEAEREMLSELCLGVYELITSEWGGSGFYVSVSDQVIPIQQLTRSAQILRETVQLGREFHVTEHVHLPWQLQLERLVYSLPDVDRIRFIDDSGNHKGFAADSETIVTLETFFDLDCNVSETAKRLYIHRNTLLYRLDKFKQESGYDVRRFRDAVLVQLGLLLYKVTKKA